MDVIETIHHRRSVRKFQDLPVEWDKIGVILDAGRVAPTPGNLQAWHFLITKDLGKRRAIAEACLQQHWISQAPYIIVIATDNHRYKSHYGVRGEKIYAVQSAAVAAENMLLAADALGLGACFISSFDEEMIARIFNIPGDAKAQVVIPIGYADEKPTAPTRSTLENVVRLESWGGIGRVGDLDATLWNFRVMNKLIDFGKEGYDDMEKSTRTERKKLGERLKEKTEQFRKDLEERGKKKRGPAKSKEKKK